MTKPWDDEHLRANIVEAFRQRALETENQRLHDELHIAHASLVKAHAQMADLVRQQQKRLVQDEVVMGVSHEIFDAVAVPVIGVDGGGMVVLINAAAQQFFPSAVPGTQIQSVDGLEFFAQGPMAMLGQGFLALRSGGRGWTVSVQRVGGRSQSQGGLLTFIPVQEEKPCP